MDDFEGKVAVVTGAASGIGLALADRFGSEGMRVVLADVERDAAGRARPPAWPSEFGAGRGAGGADRRPRRGRGRRPRRGHVRAVRHRPRRVQQRRRRRRRAGLDGARRPLALDRRRQPAQRRPRHPGLRAPHDRAGRGPRRQHGHRPRASSPDRRWRPTTPPSTAWWRCPSRCTSTSSSPGRPGSACRCCAPSGCAPHRRVRAQPARRGRRDARPGGDAGEVAPGLRDVLQGLVDGGLDPADVAGTVVDAIRSGRFWIHDAPRRCSTPSGAGTPSPPTAEPTLWDVTAADRPDA